MISDYSCDHKIVFGVFCLLVKQKRGTIMLKAHLCFPSITQRCVPLVSTISLFLVLVSCSQTVVSPSVATPAITISPTAPSPSPTSTATLVQTLTAPPLRVVPQNCSWTYTAKHFQWTWSYHRKGSYLGDWLCWTSCCSSYSHVQ